jgi:predicted AlkP superfamily phosphohydrolase/phosphomutase
MKNKVVIIGIDGVPYGVMESLSDSGVMPNFKRLRDEGIFTKMRSTIPPVSSISWSSIITGKNPAEHGIYGFMEMIPGTYTLRFPDFNSLQEQPFWENFKNKKSVIINVPSTYPVREMDGVHLSGFISLNIEKAVYPKRLLTELEKMNYKVDVNSGLAHKSTSLFLKKLNEVLEARIKCYEYLWENQDWDIFMLVFTGSDRIGHFLWDAYEDDNHQFHQGFLDHFHRIDEVIGEVSAKLNDNDALLMLSDHGMGAMKSNVYVNKVLKDNGLLNLNREMKSFNKIDKGTKAFSLDPGRIYLNYEGKYPNGSVAEVEKNELLDEIRKVFNKLEYKGEKVIKQIYSKEEIYHGPLLEKAPDLVLITNPGYRLRGLIDKEVLFDKDIFTGMHTLEDAFLYVKSPNINNVKKGVYVEDFYNLLNNSL